MRKVCTHIARYLISYIRLINVVLFLVAAAIIGGQSLLIVLLPYRAFNQYWRYLVCLSAGLPEKEPWIKWYLLQRPGYQTNLTSQQLMKFAWQIADGMSYLSSIPVSDVTIH